MNEVEAVRLVSAARHHATSLRRQLLSGLRLPTHRARHSGALPGMRKRNRSRSDHPVGANDRDHAVRPLPLSADAGRLGHHRARLRCCGNPVLHAGWASARVADDCMFDHDHGHVGDGLHRAQRRRAGAAGQTVASDAEGVWTPKRRRPYPVDALVGRRASECRVHRARSTRRPSESRREYVRVRHPIDWHDRRRSEDPASRKRMVGSGILRVRSPAAVRSNAAELITSVAAAIARSSPEAGQQRSKLSCTGRPDTVSGP